jgi:hypothetical protein
MTTIETTARDLLDRRFPVPTRDPDWADVLDRLARTGQPRSRRAAYALSLAAVLAVAGSALLLVAPWRGNPTFADRALAAIGSGRYVHAVFVSPPTDFRLIDLKTGGIRAVVERDEVVYDTKTGSEDGRWSFGDTVFKIGAGGTLADPAVKQFASGYRTALRDGKARVIGHTKVDGREATIIRFPNPLRSPEGKLVENLLYEDVAVAEDTFEPLWVRPANRILTRTHLDEGIHAAPCPCTRVVSISSTDQPVALPPGEKPQTTGFAGDVTTIRPVASAGASRALGQQALWAGPSVGEAELRGIRLQKVTTFDTAVTRWPEIGSAPGLRLDYLGPGGNLRLFEIGSPQGGYSFDSSYQSIPEPGEALLWCYHCAVRRASPTWIAQLRQNHLYLALFSKNRDLVVAAARALTPIPDGG